MDLKEMALVDPKVHWYYQAKLSALSRGLTRYTAHPRRIVDIGAGSGFFSVSMADFDAGSQVICVDPNYSVDSTLSNGAIRFVKSVEAKDVVEADVLLFIDVLEHVPDDVLLLRSYVEVAQPGAIVLITVPAFMSMWSAHDTYLEHYRRYTLSEVVSKAEKVGLEVLQQQYLFASLFAPVWIVRRVRRNREVRTDLRQTSKSLNAVLKWLLTFEQRFTSNRVAGLSAFVIARVPSSGITPYMD